MPQYDVFISYRRDRGSDLATGVRSALEDAGLKVAVDVDILQGGRNFMPQLLRTIADSRHFVLLLTAGSLDRMNEPGDVSALEVEAAYASGCHVVVMCNDKAAHPNRNTVLPASIDRVREEHMLPYEHQLARASVQKLLEALEADTRSKQIQASAGFVEIDAASKQPDFQAWQSDFLRELYTPAARAAGWAQSGLFFPRVRGHRYPVICFESAVGGEPFLHRMLEPTLHKRPVRELPKLAVDDAAAIPAWVTDSPLRQRYFELLSYAHRVRRWNMRGFALDRLRLDAQSRVTGFDARLCTYGENCLTSHVLGYDLLQSWRAGRPGELALPRPSLGAVLHPEGDDFLPLISVQAIVAYRDPDSGEWLAVTMERTGNLAAASGFWQFPPAGGFEVFGTEEDGDRGIRHQFDIRAALMREFLEEIYGDPEMACEVAADSRSDQEGTEGHTTMLEAVRQGHMSIHFLGVVTELVSLRPEFSFLIVLEDIDHFRRIHYTARLPTGEEVKVQWLRTHGQSETKKLNKSSLTDLDELFAPDISWHSSSMGMLLLLSRAAAAPDGWLRARYPDFPQLPLE